MNLPVRFSAKQIDMIMESAKTLLPLMTAFLAVAGATAKYMVESRFKSARGNLRIFVVVFAIGLVSLAAWVTTIACTVDAARAFGLADGAPPSTSIDKLNYLYFCAVKAEQIAVVTFFLAVAVFSWALLRTLRDVRLLK